MPKLKQIAIDVDVNRAIENQRRSFSESENDILRRILLAAKSETRAPRGKAATPDTDSATPTRSRGQWTLEILGERHAAANLQDAYRRLLLHFHAKRPDFLQKFSLEKGKSRRFVARNASDLYLKSPHLAADHAKQLSPGWYFDTNLSMEQVSSRARIAARLCGLHYGTDVRILENLREI